MTIPLGPSPHAIEVVAVLLNSWVIKRGRSTPDNTDTKELRILPAPSTTVPFRRTFVNKIIYLN